MLWLLVLQVDTGRVLHLREVDIGRDEKQKLLRIFDRVPSRIYLFQEDSLYWVEGWYDREKVIHIMNEKRLNEILSMPLSRPIVMENYRGQFLIFQTLLGLGVYSWSLPLMLYNENTSHSADILTALGLLTPAAWFGLSYAVSSGMRISSGAAYGSFIGGLAGAFYGPILTEEPRMVFPSSVMFNMGNFLLGQQMNLSNAAFQRHLNHIAYAYYQYFTLLKAVNYQGELIDHLKGATILAIGESYAALMLSRNDRNLTFGDAAFELRTSLIGAEFLPSLLLTYENLSGNTVSEQTYAISSLIGYAGGYYLGIYLTKKYDLSTGGAALTYLIPSIAHTFTAGITTLLHNSGMEKLYPAMFITSEIGFTYLTYRTFAKKTPRFSFLSPDRIRISINPAYALMKDKLPRTPVFQISMRF